MARRLEIGPGKRKRIPGFETLDVLRRANVDHVADCRRLPFPDGTFELVYASHVLEHIPWYQTVDTLTEWARVLTPGGQLEVWVPDGLKIAATLVDYERHGIDNTGLDGWYRGNPDRDPARWAAARTFTYGDWTGGESPNWHRALFTPRYLLKCLAEAGLGAVRLLDRGEVRAKDHGWINLGATGKKP